METRLALVADASMLAALHYESFGDASWSPSQIAESLALDTALALIAHESDEAHGFILCQIAGEEAEILTFCIIPRARRNGIGRNLLEAAIAAARQKKAQQMFLEVAVDNRTALAIYKKTGFRIIGKRPHYYMRGGRSVDAVLMVCDL